jgi:hypothetical protein
MQSAQIQNPGAATTNSKSARVSPLRDKFSAVLAEAIDKPRRGSERIK